MPVETPAQKQQRLLQEMRAQNAQFPALNRLVLGLAFYGGYALSFSLYTAFRSGRWAGLLGGAFVLLWSLSLGARLRQRTKGAWWFTVVASAFMVARFLVGLLAQMALKSGVAHATATLFYDPVKVFFYLLGLGLSGFLLVNALQKSTRDFIFAAPTEAAP